MDERRVPPHSYEAEAAILGAVLLNPAALDQIEGLAAEDFYDPRHREVYAAMLWLTDKQRPIDAITLESHLDTSGKLQAIGGLTFLGELTRHVATSHNIAEHVRVVCDKAVARRIIIVTSELAATGFGEYGDSREYAQETERRIFEVTQVSRTSNAQPIKPLIDTLFKTLEARAKSDGSGITGITTGFTDLDNITAGLQPSELIILAARPSMGKTALALSIGQNAALLAGYPVLIFSLEMSSNQLVERMLCSEGRIDSQALRRGRLDRQGMSNIMMAADRLNAAPIYIDDTAAPTVNEVRSRCRRWRQNRELFANHDTGLVLIDYLQLMRGTQVSKNSNREQEISEISRGLKALSKELKVPVVALSQLNRSLESRADKRPMLSDLRESGALEQDADVIMFIYRDEYYSKDASEKKGIAEVIVGKQRNGPTDTVELGFTGQYTRFDNLSRRQNDY